MTDLEAEAKAAAEKRYPEMGIGGDRKREAYAEGYIAGANCHECFAHAVEPAPDTDEHEAMAMLIARRLPGVNGWLEADAILAAGFRRVADQGKPQITEQMVEAGARALAEWDGADWDAEVWDWSIPREAYRHGARRCLEAALGKGGE